MVRQFYALHRVPPVFPGPTGTIHSSCNITDYISYAVLHAIILDGSKIHLGDFFWPYISLTFQAPVIFFLLNPTLAKSMVIPWILL